MAGRAIPTFVITDHDHPLEAVQEGGAQRASFVQFPGACTDTRQSATVSNLFDFMENPTKAIAVLRRIVRLTQKSRSLSGHVRV